MEGYTLAAVERAMKVQEVILKARSGAMTWLQAAEVLGIQPRTMRRWKRKLEQFGTPGLLDGRRKRPSPRRTPTAEVEQILRLFREHYSDFSVLHCHEFLVRDHGIRRSYTFVKNVLQKAGLVRRRRARGKHRIRRERRPCFGHMLHLDGSKHRWLRLAPELQPTMMVVVDDATSRVLYAQLEPNESRTAVLRALHTVFQEHGLPQQIYTDRASWAACARGSHGRVRHDRPTQVHRALEALGIEHLRAYSPQARGRGERVHGTFQGRLVSELRHAGVRTVEDANRYLRRVFIPRYNQRFAVAPTDPANGFAPLASVDLDEFLCFEARRLVGRDNTVVLGKTVLQIPKQPGRRSCERLPVLVRHHLSGGYSVRCGPNLLARYDRLGRLRGADRSDHLPKTSGQITC